MRRAYEGELIGCAMYQELSAHLDPNRQLSLRILHDVERLTADVLSPLIAHYSVVVSEEKAAHEGHRLGIDLRERSWKSLWTEVIRLAEDYMNDFEQLAGVLHEPHAAVGRQVVEHEEALIAFAQREIADDPGSLTPLLDYLNRYASKVAHRPTSG